MYYVSILHQSLLLLLTRFVAPYKILIQDLKVKYYYSDIHSPKFRQAYVPFKQEVVRVVITPPPERCGER